MRWVILAVGLAVGLAAAPAAWAPPASAEKPVIRFVDGNIPKIRYKNEMIDRFGPRYDALHDRLIARNRAGDHLPCSSQILNEAGWLIKYTNDPETTAGRLDDLERSLELTEEEQQFADHQDPADGSWGGCYEPWFWRAWASVDRLKDLAAEGKSPRYPLRFLDPVDTPEEMTAAFQQALLSRVEQDGVNRRKELNLLVTALGQLLLREDLAPWIEAQYPRAAMAEAMIRFMDEVWQDPETGWWGTWYQAGDRVVKTEDLSITFHIMSYRKGDVRHRQKIAATLFDVRERPYPYGWQDRGTQNTHHGYDVARILELTWPDLNQYQKAQAAAEIVIMAFRVVRLEIDSEGRFDPTPFPSVGEAYYFGVSFLDTIGYFDPDQVFWANRWEFPGAERLRATLLANIRGLEVLDPMAKGALRKLEARP